MWWCRNRIVKRFWPTLVLIGGFCWSQSWEWYKGIPSDDKIKQYDAVVYAQGPLVVEVTRMRAEMDGLKFEVRQDRELSISERQQILDRISQLDERLQRWFENAAKVRPAK